MKLLQAALSGFFVISVTAQPEPTPDCTSTIAITYSRLPGPPYWPQCSWDGTQHLYTTTSTVYQSVDCDGCSEVTVTSLPRVNCPAMIINATVEETTPTTTYKTVCSASGVAQQ